MPELSNKQHEAFAQAIHNGLAPVDAYETAGFVRSNADAKALASSPAVKERIAELDRLEQALSSAEENLTLRMLEDLVSPKSIAHADAIMQAYRNMTMARSLGEIGHANKALEMICRLRGLFDNPDLPDDVKKEKAHGKSVGTNGGGAGEDASGAQLFERLGNLSGFLASTEDPVDVEYSETSD